jgi:hypothetical protein
LNLQKLQQSHASAESRTPVQPKKAACGASAALALPKPKTSDEKDACSDAFLGDLRAICALIGEAHRYGATTAMEEEYRRLRTCLSAGYRALVRVTEGAALPAAGFHGCGFEMILGNYSLEGLVRNSGVRAVERLSEVWRSLSAEPTAM